MGRPVIFTEKSFKNSPGWRYSHLTKGAWKETEKVLWIILKRYVKFTELKVPPNEFTSFFLSLTSNKSTFRLISKKKGDEILKYLNFKKLSSLKLCRFIQEFLFTVIMEGVFGGGDEGPITRKDIQNLVKGVEIRDWDILFGNSYAVRGLKEGICKSDNVDYLLVCESFLDKF